MGTTEGMKGAGYYDHHSEYQRKVALSASALIRQWVDAATPPEPSRTFVVADYGCSTGRNSLASVRSAVEATREPNAQQPVAAVHNDLPTNDWNQFFANLTSDPASYVTLAGPAVLPLVSAISFYKPAAPARSVHVGLSFSAAHWLRTQPNISLPGAFYFCEATGQARAVLAAQADADWTAFLLARAADLAPGGRLLVQMVGTEPQAAPLPPHVTARKLMRAMADVAKDMVAEGKLRASIVDRYILPVYARTPEEARAPIERPGSLLGDAFQIEVARTDPVPNPYGGRTVTRRRTRTTTKLSCEGSRSPAFERTSFGAAPLVAKPTRFWTTISIGWRSASPPTLRPTRSRTGPSPWS